MRTYLAMTGQSVDEFERMPVYKNALRKQPWLREL
jgi:hypothetical protein